MALCGIPKTFKQQVEEIGIICPISVPKGCTFKGKCLPVEDRVCDGCPYWQPKKPATCSECGHPVSEHRFEGCFSKDTSKNRTKQLNYCQCYKTPADLQPAEPTRSVNAYTKKTKAEIEEQCSKCPHWEGFCMVKKCIKEPQAEMMPLIEGTWEYLPDHDNEPCDSMEEINSAGTIHYNDWNLARIWLDCPNAKELAEFIVKACNSYNPAHDQQVRKEFAEKVCRTMPRVCTYYQMLEIEAHIRVMAEEK